ncbi:TonB-dependent receptor [Nitrospirillum sp. BR 11752]|uniref:TonB-dependent receptor n=1 Tax=Nitrospirillum sp. BR 11752 TaxID=3104293 RepID=UPI002EADB78B|nr:TonB-dependent receptor [Nitrospirillum sp. BR 11752]
MVRVPSSPIAVSSLLLGTALCALTVSAWAQTVPPAPASVTEAAPDLEASGGIADIVVTAEKRQTRLQETPIALTAYTADTLQDQHISTVRDLAGLVPGLTVPRGGITPTTQLFFLRGIGETDPIFDPAIAQYVDDVYIPRSIAASPLLAELERVEVLRGPQGTLYGRNTSAGAIRYITRDPNDEVRLSVDAGVGTWGAFESHGYVSGPLIANKLYASLAYGHEQHDGYTHDPTINKDVNDLNVDSARAKLKLQATEDLDIQLTLDAKRDRSTTAYYTPKNQPGGGFDPSLSFAEPQPQNNSNSGGAALRITQALGDKFTLKSVTAYRLFGQAPVTYDNDGEAAVKQVNFIRYYENELTQEFQANGSWGPLDFTSGLFYLHENFSSDRNGFSYPSLANPPQDQVGNTKTDSYAAYGQGDYHVTDKLTGTVGLRYTIESRDFTYRQFDDTLTGTRITDASGNPIVPATATNKAGAFQTKSDATWYSLTPKFAASYQWTPDLLTYASYSKGFKAGGFDNRASALINAQLPYQPEKVETYEVGVKSQWWERRLLVNLALYYNDYTNLQATATDPATLRSRRLNAASAYTEGFELETTIQPFEGLRWDNSASYTLALYDQFPNYAGIGTSASGNRLPYAPRWTFRTAPTYTLPLAVPGQAQVGVDAQFQTLSYADVANSWQVTIPAQWNVNLFAKYTTEDERWTFSATVRNLSDRRLPQGGSYSASAAGTVWTFVESPPRTVFFKVGYKL